MATVTTIFEDGPAPAAGIVAPRAVSWPAILAGATAAAALSLILLMLGMGLGLSALSPWSSGGTSAQDISWGAIVWIAFAAFASSGLGGYIAGRLREGWPGVQRDEVFFRDTAHGFLAWAVATLLTAATLTSVIGTVVGVAGPAAVAAGTSSSGNDWAYAVDSLFRAPPGAVDGAQGRALPQAPDDLRSRAEINRIFEQSQLANALTPEDARYAGQVLAQHGGYQQAEAEQRVLDTFNATLSRREKGESRARELAEMARIQAAHASLWIFVSLLIGAFTGSLMATFGGRQRDLP